MADDTSKFDATQTQIFSYDDAAKAHRVIDASALIPLAYDSIQVSYISSGDGAGEVGTVSYYKDFDLVAMLTLVYDNQNRLTSVIRS